MLETKEQKLLLETVHRQNTLDMVNKMKYKEVKVV